jgi:hypothetical protein
MLINPLPHKKAHDETPPSTDQANPPVAAIDLTIAIVATLVVAVIVIIMLKWLRRHPATRGAGFDDS